MAVLTPPAAKSGDHQQRYRTYYNYFKAWQLLLEKHYGHTPVCPLSAVTCHPRYSNLYRRGPVSPSLAIYLRNAWSTEILLRLPFTLQPGQTSGLVSTYSCAWAPVQAYYSVYSAVVATAIAEGRVVHDHTAALNFISQTIETQCWVPTVFSFWSRGYKPLNNVSFSSAIPTCGQVSNLRSPCDADEALALVKMCLKTTRHEICEERVKSDREKKKAKQGTTLTRVEKLNIDNKLRAVTLFDFLYRVRCRCNYRETDTFIKGATIEGTSLEFLSNINEVVAHMLAFLETIICGRIGKQAMIEIVANYYLQANAGNASVPVANRWGLDF